MTCGCHCDPCGEDDPLMDLCSEATEGPIGRGWRIVHCAAHAGLPGLLEAARVVCEANEGEDWLDTLRAAVAACTGRGK